MSSTTRVRWLLIIVIGQMFYSAGAAITSGPFLIYYVKLWTSSAAVISWFLILPELVHIGALATSWLIRKVGSVKRVWLWSSIIARSMALALAGLGVVDPHAENGDVIPELFCILAVAECIRAISYTAFVAWVSELFGREHVGRLFGYREFGIVAVTMALPPLAAYVRKILLAESSVTDAAAFSAVFFLADLVVFAGIAIMSMLPDLKRDPNTEPADAEETQETFLASISRLLLDRSYRRTVFTSLHLAAAQGLTQSVFFKYQVDVLNVELQTATLLNTLMFAVQLPLAIIAGHWLDQDDNRRVYATGLFFVSCAMPFWFLTAIDRNWIFAVFAVWGAFAIVNVAGRSTVVRLVKPADVPNAITAFRFGAGLTAAASGLLGGYWLDRALKGQWYLDSLGPYLTIIAVSAVGRVTAPLWLLGWRDARTIPRRKREAKRMPANTAD